MKTIYSKTFRGAALAGALIALAACSEETYETVSQAGIPQAGDYNIVVKVDPETNQYTLNIDKPQGVYPIFKIYTKNNPVITTQDGYSDIVLIAGDYKVEMQVGNRNGISEGVQTSTIHIENTIYDFTPYMRNLTDNASKTWQIAKDLPGHLGCGPAYSEGLEWWSAAPNDKAAWGVYDNKMIFTSNGGESTGLYTYDPGESGTIYVNTGITDLAPYSQYNTNDGQDYCAPAEVQADRQFQLVAEGADLYLVLPQGTLLGYLPNVDAYNSPKFKVHSVSRNKVDLSITNADIAWHYTLAPFVEGPKPFTGFKYDSEFNLWKDAAISIAGYYYAPGWAQIADPEVDLTNEVITVNLPTATTDQWQAQVHINTGIALEAGKTYDFSCILNSSNDNAGGITVKPHPEGDDNTFLTADRFPVEAGADKVVWLSDVAGFDCANLVLTLDFGGCPDNTVVTVSNIVLKDHANDDGTVLPSEEEEPVEPEQPVSWVDVDSADNLFTGAAGDYGYYYAPGWAQIANPETTVEGRAYTLFLPEATTDQWQAQFSIPTNIVTTADKKYDFRVTFESDQDLPGVTFKCVKPGGGDNDNIFYMADRVVVPAYEEVTYKWVNKDGIDIENMTIFFDFGGNPAGTTVKIKDIIVQEHRE